MLRHILFIGVGGHYNSVSSLIEKKNYDKISAKKFFLPLTKNNVSKNKKFLINFLKNNKKNKNYIFISVGSNYVRFIIHKFLRENFKSKFIFPTIISKYAFISENVLIGSGSVIMPGVSINSNTKIGSQCIVNTNSSIDHDNHIKNFSSLGPGVNTGGNVKINTLSHIGIGSSINHNVFIEKNVIIGGGSFINKNCARNSLYFGVPGKFIKKRKLDDDYL